MGQLRCRHPQTHPRCHSEGQHVQHHRPPTSSSFPKSISPLTFYTKSATKTTPPKPGPSASQFLSTTIAHYFHTNPITMTRRTLYHITSVSHLVLKNPNRATAAVRWCCSDKTAAGSWPAPCRTASSAPHLCCPASTCAPPTTSRGCRASPAFTSRPISLKTRARARPSLIRLVSSSSANQPTRSLSLSLSTLWRVPALN